jgi:isovaleryl-CoA dehydrogenase
MVRRQQKSRILPKVCSGEWIGAMAMSEPDAGTDVLGLSTTAEKNENGDWVLNGRKMWITNGCIDDQGTPADVVWVYARTGFDEKGRTMLSTFLVENGMPGYSVGQKIFDKTWYACIQHCRVSVRRLYCSSRELGR